MNQECAVIRDLLPLYADDVCSDASRELIEKHLPECPECTAELEKLRSHEIESNLQSEKTEVIEYQAKRFKRRSAAVGSVIAGIFMIPILVCLIVNIATGSGLGWFFIVLGGLAVAASLTVVPLMVPEDKQFWTFCAFCASLVLLLAVCAINSGGGWFFTAASGMLFGLGVIFLPFVVRARPVRDLIGDFNRPLLVLGADMILFANMMNMISLHSKSVFVTILMAVACIGAAALLGYTIKTKRGEA